MWGSKSIMAFTFFFRDAQILEMLIENALPALIGQSHIRIWDAGCAHGPEPYTLAMLLREKMSDCIFHNVKIYATDVDPTFAANVRLGIFPINELQRLPVGFFHRYFRAAAEPGYFQISEDIRSRIEFNTHDLLNLEPIREGLSLIVCKNVLLHFNETQRINVLRMFHAAMRKDGMLAMEHTQKMPEALQSLFQQAASYVQVYQKIENPTTDKSYRIPPAAWYVDLPDGMSLPHHDSKPTVSSDR
jgi:chemotaxis protein methyltransferase CheR